MSRSIVDILEELSQRVVGALGLPLDLHNLELIRQSPFNHRGSYLFILGVSTPSCDAIFLSFLLGKVSDLVCQSNQHHGKCPFLMSFLRT